MSFNNDEDGDGLAALFGGVTPQTDPGPRRAAPAAPEPTPPAAAAPPVAAPPLAAPPLAAPPLAAPPPVAAQYPGLAPQAPLAYDLPAPAAAPLASPYGAPSTPSYPGLASPPQQSTSPAPQSPQYPGAAPAPQAPPSYDLPEPGAQQYPGVAPSAPAYPATAQYPAGALPSAPSQEQVSAPPAYQPAPEYQPAPTYQPPAAYQTPRAYEPPPAYGPPVAYEPPSAYQVPPDAPPSFPQQAYTSPAAEAPVYSPPAGAGYDLPAVAPPPAPLHEPPSYAAPPPAGEPYTAPPVLAEPPRVAEPIERPAPEHPLVRSEPAVPATVFPPGPLLPSSTAAVETPEYLERSTAAEKVGLVLAVLTGPIGLAVAIANAVRSGRRRGWLIGIVRASLVLGVLSTIAAGIGGYLYWTIRADQIQHAEIAAASAEFCAAAEADPTMVAPPTLGWPAQGASVGETLTLMQAWTDRWTTLAATAPAGLREGLELLADKGQTIIDAVTESRIVDDTANQTQIAQAQAQSGVSDWHATYCLEP